MGPIPKHSHHVQHPTLVQSSTIQFKNTSLTANNWYDAEGHSAHFSQRPQPTFFPTRQGQHTQGLAKEPCDRRLQTGPLYGKKTICVLRSKRCSRSLS